MFLKKIELQGFKSFPNKVTFEVNNGITGIVGPNGSGKSNIVDAIRWVLGEQSMKTLRGSKSDDVIFNGTQARKPLGFAEISLYVDNSLGTLPINYSEVVVTRRIYRSGESEFSINKNPCRLKDINELFMGTGVGKDGYSIIGQGKIDEILSNKIEDRRVLFEEATGIMKYKVRKNESEKKLEDTLQNLDRISDIIGELELQIGPLEEQSSKAKKYLNLREELKKMEISLFVENCEKLKIKMSESISNIDNVIVHINDEENLFLKLQDEKKLKQLDIENIEKGLDDDNLRISDTVNEIERKNSDINVTLEKIKSNEENFERLDLEIIQYQEKLGALEEDISKKCFKLENLNESKQKFENDKKIKEEELSKIGANIEIEESQISSIEDKINKYDNEINELKNLNNSSNVVIDSNKTRLFKIEEELTKLISDKDSKVLNDEINKKNIAELNKKILEQTENINGYALKKNGLENEINDFKRELDSFIQNLNFKKARYKFLNDLEEQQEGYSKSVKEVINASNKLILNGIHGALASLISVDKKYEVAIEIALGGALQNIVTDDENTAKKSIEYLKKNDFGRATFLPITSVVSKSTDYNENVFKNYEGFLGVASEVVKSKSTYKGIIKNLLDRTLIVDNLENGIQISKKIKYGYRIVTVDGDIINTSGSMTGGSNNKKNSKILGRSREILELKEDIEKLENLYHEKEENLKISLKKFEDFNNDYISLNDELQQTKINLIKQQEQISNSNSIVSLLDEKIKALKFEKQNISETIENMVSSVELNLEKILVLESDMNNIESEYEILKNSFADKYSEKSLIYEDITNIKISLTSIDESINSMNEVIGMLKKDVDETNGNINKRILGKEKIVLKNDEYREFINLAKAKIESLNESIKDKKELLEENKNKKLKLNAELLKISDDVVEQLKNIEKLKSEKTHLEYKKSKIESELDELQNRMWDEYEMTLGKAEEFKIDKIDVYKVSKDMNRVKNEIKDLGSVNVDAIDEYIKVKERYEFLTNQKNDLEESEKKLRKVIFEMLSIMKKQFSEKFNVISKNFDETFRELFNGGKANLRLVDENNILESPIEIEAQPPGKRLQNLMSLSGGERAFTAIALLFAIFKINPSPFCVLDEIEAALDEANVFKFADYIKDFSNATQFLVITHRKGTMEIADSLYGVTMEEKGVSKLVSMKLN